MTLINYLRHCLGRVIQFQQWHEIHTRLPVPSCVESISNFYSTNIFKYRHCYQIFLDMLFPHYEDMLSCLVMRWKKNGQFTLFLNITMDIFYVAACFLFKICLVYMLQDLAQYTNIFQQKTSGIKI